MSEAPSDPQADPDVVDLFARNRAWAAAKTATDAEFFKRLVPRQTPPYLWIGCSDSRAPVSAMIDGQPGEIFVHRNIANLAEPQDDSAGAVLQYAVGVLQVRHVLVVGHYGCGGVKAALEHAQLGSPLDGWLSPIRALAVAHKAELDALADDAGRHDRLCELNVLAQVANVAKNPSVCAAWDAGRALTVHGWCYSLATGQLTDLHADVSGRPRP